MLLAIAALAVAAIMAAGVGVYREDVEAILGQRSKHVTAAIPDKSGVTAAPQLVDVSFVSDPFEAKIYLDDKLLRRPDGEPYTTPCTVSGLPARTCRVAFQIGGERRWIAEGGPYDLSRIRQIVSKRP